MKVVVISSRQGGSRGWGSGGGYHGSRVFGFARSLTTVCPSPATDPGQGSAPLGNP